MATKTEANPGDDGLKRGEFSDFALVLKDGQELKCHKVKLAEVSPVFRAMLREDYEETRTNRMKMTEFDQETVLSFLDYIYSDLKRVPVQDIFKKSKFDEERLTLDLLRLCHMYQVTDLGDKCSEHLSKNIADANVLRIWSVAETIGNNQLRKRALDHLGKKKGKMLELPGLKEALETPQLRESLVTYLSARMNPDAVEEDKVITVNIVCLREKDELVSTETVTVKRTETVKTLIALTNSVLSSHGLKIQSICKFSGPFGFGSARLKENGIEDNSNVGCFVTKS